MASAPTYKLTLPPEGKLETQGVELIMTWGDYQLVTALPPGLSGHNLEDWSPVRLSCSYSEPPISFDYDGMMLPPFASPVYELVIRNYYSWEERTLTLDGFKLSAAPGLVEVSHASPVKECTVCGGGGCLICLLS